MVAPDKPKKVGVIWVTGQYVDRSGLSRYTHLIRSADDPGGTPREMRKGHQLTWLKDMHPGTTDKWAKSIYKLLSDRVPRTFNRIVLELSHNLHTADVAFDKAPDHALWDLVVSRKISHTTAAPILFRRTR